MMPTYHLHNPLLLLLCLMSLTACVPTHTVRPLPEFVQLALEPGDSVKIILQDGTKMELTLSAVHADAIEGNGRRFELTDIRHIQKRAWKAPPMPCGGEKPVGCSVPLLLQLTSETTRHYKSAFHAACVQHDFCYRHGASSYGHTRDDCDDEFLDNMLARCPPPPRGVLSKTMEILNDSHTSRRQCISTAKDFHQAIRVFGDKYYRSDESTYCEYDGPPPATAPASASPGP